MSSVSRLINFVNSSSPINTQTFDILQKLKDTRKSVNKKQLSIKGGVQNGQYMQGIMYAAAISESEVIIVVTLLAAGFLLGKSGSSMDEICSLCSVSSTSWCSQLEMSGEKVGLRVFSFKGQEDNICKAINIAIQAVNRYKNLTEGPYQDKVVAKIQSVCGVEFLYKPPPIHMMPCSARTIQFKDVRPSVYGQIKAAVQRGEPSMMQDTQLVGYGYENYIPVTASPVASPMVVVPMYTTSPMLQPNVGHIPHPHTPPYNIHPHYLPYTHPLYAYPPHYQHFQF